MFRYSIVFFALLFFSTAHGLWVATKNTDKFIKLALSVSKAAYLPFSTERFISNGYIQERTTRHGYRRSCSIGDWVAKGYERRDTEVLVFRNHKQKLAVFGFRGTNTLNDWLKNFNVFLVEVKIRGKRFRIHQGFRNRYSDIKKWFEAEYRSIPRNYKIIVTGHSLGGAMATVASTFVSGHYHRRPDAVISFGSPRVGNDDFQKYYSRTVGCKNTLRITAKYDIFPVLPGKGFGYTDTCKPQKVNSGVFQFNPFMNHDLYIGYEGGLKRKYGNDMKSINSGCDRNHRGR